MIDPRIAAACVRAAGAIVRKLGCGSSTTTTIRTVARTQTGTLTTTGHAAAINEGRCPLPTTPIGGSWHVHRIAMTGADNGCPVDTPARLLAVWGRAPESCQAPDRRA